MRNAVIYVMRRPGVHAGRIGITVSSRGQSAACDWPDSLALDACLPDCESRGIKAPTVFHVTANARHFSLLLSLMVVFFILELEVDDWPLIHYDSGDFAPFFPNLSSLVIAPFLCCM